MLEHLRQLAELIGSPAAQTVGLLWLSVRLESVARGQRHQNRRLRQVELRHLHLARELGLEQPVEVPAG